MSGHDFPLEHEPYENLNQSQEKQDKKLRTEILRSCMYPFPVK
jgi:hypothetical protein